MSEIGLSAFYRLDPKLINAAGMCYEVFEGLVAATLDHPDDSTIKAATIAVMSTTYGFAGDRLEPFMVGDLIDTVLSIKVTTLRRVAARKRLKNKKV